MEGQTGLVGRPINSVMLIYLFGWYPFISHFILVISLIRWLVETALLGNSMSFVSMLLLAAVYGSMQLPQNFDINLCVNRPSGSGAKG